METLGEPSFELVVEIESYSFSDRESPSRESGAVSDEQFQMRLADCLKDAHLDHLVPIQANSMFYEAGGLDQASLKILVADHLTYWADDEDYSVVDNVSEYGSSFSGGIAILDRGACVSVPGCCCGLDSLAEWYQVFDQRPSNWLDLWIGHDADSLEVKFDQCSQEFCFRLSKWLKRDWDRQFTLSVHAFESELKRSKQTAAKLSKTIIDALDQQYSSPESRMAIAQRIAGLI